MSDESHWIITNNGKINVWKCKLIFPTDTLLQKIETTDFKPFLAGDSTSGLRLLHSTLYITMISERSCDTEDWSDDAENQLWSQE